MPAPRPVSGTGERSSTVTSQPAPASTWAAVSPPIEPPATRTRGPCSPRPARTARRTLPAPDARPPDRGTGGCDPSVRPVHTRGRPPPPPTAPSRMLPFPRRLTLPLLAAAALALLAALVHPAPAAPPRPPPPRPAARPRRRRSHSPATAAAPTAGCDGRSRSGRTGPPLRYRVTVDGRAPRRTTTARRLEGPREARPAAALQASRRPARRAAAGRSCATAKFYAPTTPTGRRRGPSLSESAVRLSWKKSRNGRRPARAATASSATARPTAR